MNGSELDRLIDVLLREELGGEAPPDLSTRISAAVGRRVWTRLAALAAGLLVAAAAGSNLLTGPSYPEPVARGEYEIEGSGRLERGAVVVATGPAGIDLGGYARVELEPGTRVRLAGKPRAEAVELVGGRIDCSIEGGSFQVSTRVGEVKVTGTRFLVEYTKPEHDGGGDMIRERLWVKVLAGAVILVLGGQEYALAQDEEGGTFRGVVSEVGEKSFRVEGEGGKSMEFHPRWIGGAPADGGGLDKAMLEQIHKLMAGDKVAVEWKWEERPRALKIEVLEAAPRKGTFDGVVREKGENWFRVEGEGGKSMRFVPRWIGGAPADGGGFEKRILEKIRELEVGQRVRVRWEYEERPRALEIAVR